MIVLKYYLESHSYLKFEQILNDYTYIEKIQIQHLINVKMDLSCTSESLMKQFVGAGRIQVKKIQNNQQHRTKVMV